MTSSDLPGGDDAHAAYVAAYDRILARGTGRMIPDLDRITRLAGLLGDPQTTYPSVHITGTNGKTSVARMVTTLVSGLGLSAGTYTSPHLQSPRERLSVAGRPISEVRFAEVAAELEPLAALVDAEATDPRDHVTFFEYLTAMAYWWFADLPVDVAVVEVGMGGRWDATNLVRGDVAVLTNIDVDHRELGATPAEIAGEKVGIIKPGSRVVSAAQSDEVAAVIATAVERQGATLARFGHDFDVVDHRVAVGGQLVGLRVGERRIDDILLPLFGEHQARNAAVALAAVDALLGESLARADDAVIREAFAAVRVPGRLEVVSRAPTVVLDGAHNPHGARTIAATLRSSFGFRNVILVLASLADKDLAGIVAAYRDLANHVVVTRAPNPRAATVRQLQAVAEEVWAGTGVVVESAADVESALQKAMGVAGEADGVLVTGSLYTVGAARDHFLPVEPDRALPTEPSDPVTEAEEEAAFNAALEEMLGRLDDESGPDR